MLVWRAQFKVNYKKIWVILIELLRTLFTSQKIHYIVFVYIYTYGCVCIHIYYMYFMCIIHLVLIMITISLGLLSTRCTKKCESTKFTFINVTFPTCPPPYFKLCLKSHLIFLKKLEWISNLLMESESINKCYQFSNNKFYAFSFHILNKLFHHHWRKVKYDDLKL